jgi:hypothetical protein
MLTATPSREPHLGAKLKYFTGWPRSAAPVTADSNAHHVHGSLPADAGDRRRREPHKAVDDRIIPTTTLIKRCED